LARACGQSVGKPSPLRRLTGVDQDRRCRAESTTAWLMMCRSCRVGDGERAGRMPWKVSMTIIRPPQQGHRCTASGPWTPLSASPRRRFVEPSSSLFARTPADTLRPLPNLEPLSTAPTATGIQRPFSREASTRRLCLWTSIRTVFYQSNNPGKVDELVRISLAEPSLKRKLGLRSLRCAAPEAPKNARGAKRPTSIGNCNSPTVR
jgi:hypothetical protein